MAALKARYAKQEDAPEWLRPHMRQLTEGRFRGQWVPDVDSEDGFGLEDVKGLKDSLESERTRVRENERHLAELKAKFGDMDPEEARKALERIRKAGGDLSKDEAVQAQIQAAIKELKTAHEKEKSSLAEQVTKLTGSVRRLVVRNRLQEAITKAEGNAELLMPHAEAFADVDGLETDNPRLVFLSDDRKSRRPSLKSGVDALMDADEFVESLLKPRFPPAFKGPGARGSGKTGDNADRFANGRVTISREDAKDAGKYQAAQARAEKAGQEFAEIVD